MTPNIHAVKLPIIEIADIVKAIGALSFKLKSFHLTKSGSAKAIDTIAQMHQKTKINVSDSNSLLTIAPNNDPTNPTPIR